MEYTSFEIAKICRNCNTVQETTKVRDQLTYLFNQNQLMPIKFMKAKGFLALREILIEESKI